MKKIKFWKMHGLGNDFVILDFRKNVTNLRKDQISLIANRKFGLGCDQLIIIKKGNKFFDVEILMYNSDGSETDTCGNGTRCVASILFNEKNNEIYKIKTKAYVVSAWKDKSNKNFISVDLGTIKTQWHEIPLEKEVNTLFLDLNENDLNLASCLSLGNPHTVFFVKDLHNIDIKKIGKNIENHSLFPDKTNVESGLPLIVTVKPLILSFIYGNFRELLDVSKVSFKTISTDAPLDGVIVSIDPQGIIAVVLLLIVNEV